MSEQKVVWITGASSGIGEALARVMARDGWRVYASARRADRLEALGAQGPNAMVAFARRQRLDFLRSRGSRLTA